MSELRECPFCGERIDISVYVDAGDEEGQWEACTLDEYIDSDYLENMPPESLFFSCSQCGWSSSDMSNTGCANNQENLDQAIQRINSRPSEYALRNELADALDVKNGNGPTALSMVVADRDALRARVRELEEAGHNKALADVLQERAAQELKWGEQNHDPFAYLAILVEEVGELSQAALHTRFGGRESGRMREEAVQTAAVALAIVECLDRGKWQWPVNLLLPTPPEKERK